MHSLGRELKKKLLYSSIDRIYGSFEFVLFTSEIASSVFVTIFLVSLNEERERERVVVQVQVGDTFNDRVFNILGPVHLHVGLTFNDLSSKTFFVNVPFFATAIFFS